MKAGGTISDINGSGVALKMMPAHEEMFRALAEYSPDIIMLFDRSLRHIYCNRAIMRYTRRTPREFIGKTPRDVGFPEGRADEIEQMLREVFRNGKPQRTEVMTHGLTFDWLLSPTMGANGEVTHVITTARDVTVLRRVNEALSRAEKMEAIGNLASGIAHDFNNILQAILGYATLIKMNHPEEDDDHVRARLISEAATSAIELIRRILGFARSTPGECFPLDLNEELAKIVQMYTRTRKEIEVHLHLAGHPLVVEADRVQLEQVFLNILVNAGQAMPEGGDIYIETAHVAIDAKTASIHRVQAGEYVKVSITDTGIGMDEATRSRIFEPFFTTKTPGEGTGLGLTAAYGIVSAHNGFINVYSEQGRGTTFSIYLPVSSTDLTRIVHQVETFPRGNEPVLIVDDEPPVLDVAAEILRYLGYVVFKATSGEEALKIYAERRDEIKVVIIDMIMPRMSGRELFLRLKEMNPDVSVCITSGYTKMEEARELLHLGARSFVQKPYTISDLACRLREILD